MPPDRPAVPYVAPAGEVPVVLHRPDGEQTRCGQLIGPEWGPVRAVGEWYLCAGCMPRRGLVLVTAEGVVVQGDLL